MPDPLRVLLVGCGDLGARVASLRASEWQLAGVRRSDQTMPGIRMIAADARSSVALQSVLTGGFDIVVATMTPPEFSDAGYVAGYVEPARALVEACQWLPPSIRPQRIFWVSSTRVFGENRGEWVDETTEPRPQDFAGRRLLEAEQVLQAGVVPVTVVRFSGIYGPGRDRLLRKVRSGRIAPAAPLQWTNRIHSDDCAGVLVHLIEREARGEGSAGVYIGTDSESVGAHEVQWWLAERLGISAMEEPVSTTAESGRRCSNRRLLESGYRFRYPTWRDGYETLLTTES